MRCAGGRLHSSHTPRLLLLLCQKGKTPLMHAVFKNSIAIVAALIKAGADLNLKDSGIDLDVILRQQTVRRQSFPDILGRFVTEALVRFLFKFRRPQPGAATGVFGWSAS